MKVDRERLMPVAKKAVVLAARVTRRVQAELERVRAIVKNDQSPVTVADLASQAIVAKTLADELGINTLVAEEDADALAADPALAEEVLQALSEVWPGAAVAEVSAAIDRGRGDPAGLYFTLDPIDGTKGFLRGEQYAVSLGAIENGRVLMGVLGCPALSSDLSRAFSDPDPVGLMYFAARGEGFSESSLQDLEARAVLQVRPKRDPRAPIRLVESVEAAHTKHDANRAVLEKVGVEVEPARLDSQAKYAVIARGQADVYLRMPSKKGYVEKIWDHAAGALIAEEAGLVVSDVRGAPLDFSRGRTLAGNLGVVAAPPELHVRLIRAIAELGLDREEPGGA